MNGVPRVPSKSPYSFSQKLRMALWWFVEAIFFRPSLHKMNAYRCFILRCFGAKIGVGTFIFPSAKIWFPWNLEIGDNAGIGFDALVYNLDKVVIEDYATVSQRCHLNTGSHDYSDPAFPLITKPISIRAGAFVGADSYIGWGVEIGSMAVIGARSVVVADIPGYVVAVGHPCKVKKKFQMRTS